MTMTLEQVRDWHLEKANNIRAGISTGTASVHDRMASAIDAHLSAQAKVRVTDEDVDRACDVYDDHYTAEVLSSGVGSDNHSQALRAAIESFAARLSQGARDEAVGDVYWEHTNGESEMRANWFGNPPPIGTMLYTQPQSPEDARMDIKAYPLWIALHSVLCKYGDPVVGYVRVIEALDVLANERNLRTSK